MASYFKSFFKRYLEEFFDSVDAQNIDFENMHTMNMKNLKLREDHVSAFNEFCFSQSPMDLIDVSIGTLLLTMPQYGKVDLNAGDVTFHFNFTPLRSILNAYDGGAEAVPGFAYKMQDIRSADHWTALLNAYDSSQSVQTPESATPRFCAPHRLAPNRIVSDVQIVNCKLCSGRVQTNYKFCGLCPTCSAHYGRCLICDSRRIRETPEQELARVARTTDLAFGVCDEDTVLCEEDIGLGGEHIFAPGSFDDDHVVPIGPSSSSGDVDIPESGRRSGRPEISWQLAESQFQDVEIDYSFNRPI